MIRVLILLSSLSAIEPYLWTRNESILEITNAPVWNRGLGTYLNTNTAFYGGQFGLSAFFPKTNASVGDLVYYTNWPMPTNGCIEFWFKPDVWTITNTTVSDGGVHFLCSRNSLAGGSPYVQMEIENGNGFRCSVYDGATEMLVDVTTLYITNRFYHIAMSWMQTNTVGGTAWIFLDGALVASVTNAALQITNGMVFPLAYGGVQNSANFGARGYIDNLKTFAYFKTDFSDRFNERGGLNDLP